MKALFFVTCILCINVYISAVKERPPWFNLSIAEWNEQYGNGAWQYLNTEPLELARSSVIGVYYQTYGNRGAILDVGCGEGVLTDMLHKRKSVLYTGIDLSKVAINNAKQKRPGFDFQCENLASYVPTKSFNIIVFNEVLYYVDHERELVRYSKYLKKNGKIVISLWSKNAHTHDHEDIFSFADKLLSFVHSMSFSGLTTSTVNNETYIANFKIHVYQLKN